MNKQYCIEHSKRIASYECMVCSAPHCKQCEYDSCGQCNVCAPPELVRIKRKRKKRS